APPTAERLHRRRRFLRRARPRAPGGPGLGRSRALVHRGVGLSLPRRNGPQRLLRSGSGCGRATAAPDSLGDRSAGSRRRARSGPSGCGNRACGPRRHPRHHGRGRARPRDSALRRRLERDRSRFPQHGCLPRPNFCMPMSLARKSVPTSFVFAPVLLTAYISALTYLAREEVGGNTLERARRGVTALAVVALVMAVAIAPWPAAPFGWAFLAVLVARGAMLFAPLWTEPGGLMTGR